MPGSYWKSGEKSGGVVVSTIEMCKRSAQDVNVIYPSVASGARLY